jgi:hypothetical protein
MGADVRPAPEARDDPVGSAPDACAAPSSVTATASQSFRKDMPFSALPAQVPPATILKRYRLPQAIPSFAERQFGGGSTRYKKSAPLETDDFAARWVG